MKKLYLVRHAKSSLADAATDDFDRPLNERGEKDAPHMAKLVKDHNITPDRMISSPANRALSTCQIFARTFQFDSAKINTEKKLYHASADTILKVLGSLQEHQGEEEEVVFLFGHNPGITAFANLLFNSGIDNIPTCGVVGITLNIETWREISFGCGNLNSFEYPKMNN